MGTSTFDETATRDETVNEFADRLFSSANGFAYFIKEIYEAEREHHLVGTMTRLVALSFASNKKLLSTMRPQDWEEARGMSNKTVHRLATTYLERKTTVGVILNQDEQILARPRLKDDYTIFTDLILPVLSRVRPVLSLEQFIEKLIQDVLIHKQRMGA